MEDSGCFQYGEQCGKAIAIERFIKKQKSRKLIEQLCDMDFVPNGILAQLVRVPGCRGLIRGVPVQVLKGSLALNFLVSVGDRS